MIRIIKISLLLLLFALSSSGEVINNNDPVTLSNEGVICGTVYSHQGGTLNNAKVILYSSRFSAIDTVITGSDGQFNFMLSSGKYYVSAEAFDYIKRFHPNRYMVSSAQQISVLPSQVINISFNLEPGGAVSGEITSGVNYEEDFLVSAVKVDFPFKGWQRDEVVQITNQGYYYLDGLLPGYYKIFVRAEGFQTQFYPGVDTYNDAEIVLVTAGEIVEGVDFILNQPGSGIVSGYVYDISTNTPIEGAEVLAYTWTHIWGDPYQVNAFTDINGYYELDVTAGYYYLEAVVDGGMQSGNIIHLYYNNRLDYKLADVLNVEPLQTVTDIDFNFDFTLSYNLDISGTMFNLNNGYPLEDVQLTALDYNTGQPMAYGISSKNGNFTIGNLVSSIYIVEISGYSVIPGFWPDVFYWQDADPIELTSSSMIIHDGGAITQDYGIPGFSISGVITDPEGALENVRLYAINIDNDRVAFSLSNQNGLYDVSQGLHEGQYMVIADLFNYNGMIYPYTIQLDLIQSPVVEDIDFYLEPLTVDIEPDISLPSGCRLLGNFPNPFNSSTKIIYSSQTQFNSYLDIYNINGQLIRSISISSQMGVNTIYWDGKSVNNESVSSGLYFYKIRDLANSRKMILLK